MSAKVQSVIARGSRGTIVDIECHLSNNLPNIVIVGSASKAVDEARERIRGAFATSRIMLPRKRITVNLAPADIPKVDSGFDLAIAVAILLANGQVTSGLDRRQAFIGELGLDGATRAVRGIIGKLLAGRARGIQTFYVPRANLRQAQLVPNISLVPVGNLGELYAHLCEGRPPEELKTGSGLYQMVSPVIDGPCLSEVVGQAEAKRALEIAAAGGHNVFFSGPPGTGKSLMAKALPSILPPLDREEVLEVTHLHSLASQDYENLVSQRPFRSPHHSASHVAIVGGGSRLRPGEISLSHRGVLFLDELPEFSRETLEALRQPLEDRVINVARARDTVQYPADFILVATANPCPCGYYGNGVCDCTEYQRKTYSNRLSGPILDRIDLFCNVHRVDHDRLLTQEVDPIADAKTLQRVTAARVRQAERSGSPTKLNASLLGQELKEHAHLDQAGLQLLNKAAKIYGLSARSYMRTIRVARTIADLEASTSIQEPHIAEALDYRMKALKGSALP